MVVTNNDAHRDSLAFVPSFTEQDILLNDKYEYRDSLTSVLGYGAFGVVYKGVDRETKTNVAIKKVPRANVKENELKVIRALKSPYLVGVLDICSLDEATCCLIMECCTCDLDYHIQHVSVAGRLNDENLRLIIDNLARGYKALYELKIVHRDLKPQNILVTYNGCSKQLASARITDFGIARTLDDDENSELCNVAGTFFYMAPEVGANLVKICNYNSQSDMWSIGVLLYQCLTGQIPFDECSMCKLFLYTACDNFDAYDPPELPTSTNEQVAEIIHSLLEIDSHRRLTPVEFYKRAIEYSVKSSPVIC